MIKTAYRVMAVFWITSPMIYAIARLTGLYNYHNDAVIAAGLSLISFFVCFLCYKRW